MIWVDNLIIKIKKYLEKVNNKKLMNNLFIILIIGIILLIVANIIMGEKKDIDINPGSVETLDDPINGNLDYESILEGKLENILSQMAGVNKVKVMITLEDTLEKIPAFNTTQNNETTNEIDSQGGTRETIREDMTIQVATGSEGSFTVLKEIKPTVKGVIVIAEGAENLEVKEMLYEAVKTVLGIPGNKVEVYSSK